MPRCKLLAAFLPLLRSPQLPSTSIVQHKHGDPSCAELQEVGSLHTLASEGAPEPLRRCLAAGADVNGRDAEGCTALHWAADRGHLQVGASPAGIRINCCAASLQTEQSRTAQEMDCGNLWQS